MPFPYEAISILIKELVNEFERKSEMSGHHLPKVLSSSKKQVK